MKIFNKLNKKKYSIFSLVFFCIFLARNIASADVLRGKVLCNDKTPYHGKVRVLHNERMMKKIMTDDNGEYMHRRDIY